MILQKDIIRTRVCVLWKCVTVSLHTIFNLIQFSLFVFISHMIHKVINNGKNDFYTISMRDVDAIKER